MAISHKKLSFLSYHYQLMEASSVLITTLFFAFYISLASYYINQIICINQLLNLKKADIEINKLPIASIYKLE